MSGIEMNEEVGKAFDSLLEVLDRHGLVPRVKSEINESVYQHFDYFRFYHLDGDIDTRIDCRTADGKCIELVRRERVRI